MVKRQIRIDGKCGTIQRLIKREDTKLVEIKLNKRRKVEIGIGLLKATPKMFKMTADDLNKELKKEFHGRKVGDRACISSEEPLYN